VKYVIADTTPLYAAFDPSDQYHGRSQSELQQLEERDIAIVILYPTLLEAYTLVSHRLGTRQALKFQKMLIEGSELLNPTVQDYEAAIQRVSDYPDQRITLVDAVNAVVSGRMKVPVWTYDFHFDIMQVKVWLL
jgi:predicted nucleic acid-binding protein